MRNRWGSAAFSVLLLAPHLLLAADGRRVGEYGAPDRLVISGCKAVPAEAVRQALLRDWEAQVASAPTAPLDDYVFLVRRKVRLGFQSSGFPRATVDAQADDGGRVNVTISEGPRYRCGPINVHGTADPVESAKITSMLARVNPPETFNGSANETGVRVGLDFLADQDRADWPVGDFADFSPTKVDDLRNRVDMAMKCLGFFAAKFDVSVDIAGESASLNVTVRDAGPRTRLHRIDVDGASANKPQEVIRFLELRPRQPVGMDDLLAAQRKLWDSARFKSHVITGTFTGPDHSGLDVRIRLEELRGVPPLAQPLTALEEAAVRCGRWLVERCRAGDDVMVDLRSPDGDTPYSARLGLGSGGIFGQLEAPATGPAANEPATRSTSPGQAAAAPNVYAATITRHLAGVYSPDARCVNHAGHPLNGSVTAACVAEMQQDGTSEWKLNLAAFLATANTGFKLHVTLAPAAMVSLVSQYQALIRYESVGSVLQITGADGGRMRIETATGRLLECSFQKDGRLVRVSVGPGLIESAAKAFDDQHRAGINQYDEAEPMESLVRFVADGWWEASKRMPALATGGGNGMTRLIAGLRLLGPPAASVFSNTLLNPGNDPDETFGIPAPRQAGMANPIAAFLLSALPGADTAFRRGSWPWTLARQSMLVYSGLTDSFQPEMERMLASNQVGPIGYLVAAEWLNRMNPRAATSLAKIGLQHLSDDDFSLDVAALTAGGGTASRAIAGWAEHLRQMPEHDAEELAAALPAGARAPTRDLIAALRATRAQPIKTALPPALRAAWKTSWREAVRKELQALAPEPLDLP